MSNERWYTSKTKWAGILGGVTLILPSVISWLNGGDLSWQGIGAGITAILATFGIRDAIDSY